MFCKISKCGKVSMCGKVSKSSQFEIFLCSDASASVCIAYVYYMVCALCMYLASGAKGGRCSLLEGSDPTLLIR